MPPSAQFKSELFVQWFRSAAPYIYAFRGRTFVIAFGGELLSEGQFVHLAHDLNLLNSLGVRLVLVHGARPQVEARLRAHGHALRYVNGLRVTDALALDCLKEAAGTVRVEIEAMLSMGLPNSPMHNSVIRVASGNFLTAKPAGVRFGVDLLHTGEVRRIDAAAIQRRLEDGEIVLLSPLGYSPTGEIFNIALEEVATATAIALDAEKLIFLMNTNGVTDAQGALLHQLTVPQAQEIMNQPEILPEDVRLYLPSAIRACSEGVARAHLISRHIDGALLQEIFTHLGIGTMVTETVVETLRPADIGDVGGILELLAPLEEDGILVRRPRELLEMEIDRFVVIEHDGVIIGCAALYPFPEEHMAEMACLAVARDYRSGGRGDALLAYIEARARDMGVRELFVLTTRTAHWFIERGFAEANVDELPDARQKLYNFQRRSKVFLKPI